MKNFNEDVCITKKESGNFKIEFFLSTNSYQTNTLDEAYILIKQLTGVDFKKNTKYSIIVR